MSTVANAVAKFYVLLVGLGDKAPCIREVVLTEREGFTPALLDPHYVDAKLLLGKVFKYGQNDFVDRNCRSVSVGDFIMFKPVDMFGEIEYGMATYRVDPVGFTYIRTVHE